MNNKKMYCSLVFLFLLISMIFQPVILTFSQAIQLKFPSNSSPLIQFSSHSYFACELKPNQLFDTIVSTNWIRDSSFDNTLANWVPSVGGDVTDVLANASIGQGDCTVIGDIGSVSIVSNASGVWIPSEWTETRNPAFPVEPDNAGIDTEGSWMDHIWDESVNQTRNTPSVRWERNVTIEEDMSDYEITAASITATVNGSVDTNIETKSDNPSQGAVGDYCRFYVKISDIDKALPPYELAWNQTVSLGQDVGPITTMSDTYMTNVTETALIFYISSVLLNDPHNFTIILGIDLYCEDNIAATDLDTWNYLRINYLNFWFTFEKKIDRSSWVSWSQVGNAISGENIQIMDAVVSFNFKVDRNWTLASPNSEIRVLLNDNPHTETVKLTSATTVFQTGSFRVTSRILKDVPISLTLQVYLADNFKLDSNTTISFDDVSLIITYKIKAENLNLLPIIIGLIAGLVAIVSIFSLYQFYFKYPPIVRKIRNTKNKVKKGKRGKPISVKSRQEIINEKLEGQRKPFELDIKQAKKGVGSAPPTKGSDIKGGK